LPFKLVQALAPCQFQTIMHLDENIYTIAMQILVLYSEVTNMAIDNKKTTLSYVILKSNSKQQNNVLRVHQAITCMDI
jgi:hypothetical protein